MYLLFVVPISDFESLALAELVHYTRFRVIRKVKSYTRKFSVKEDFGSESLNAHEYACVFIHCLAVQPIHLYTMRKSIGLVTSCCFVNRPLDYAHKL